MAEVTRVKNAITAALKATKTSGAPTKQEATACITAWSAVCDDAEASASLKAQATYWRRELELQSVAESATGKEYASAQLAAVARSFS